MSEYSETWLNEHLYLTETSLNGQNDQKNGSYLNVFRPIYYILFL